MASSGPLPSQTSAAVTHLYISYWLSVDCQVQCLKKAFFHFCHIKGIFTITISELSSLHLIIKRMVRLAQCREYWGAWSNVGDGQQE